MIKTFQKIVAGISVGIFAAMLLVLPFVVNTVDAQTKSPTNSSTKATTPTPTQICDDLKAQLNRGGFEWDKEKLPEYCTTNTLYNKIIKGALYAVGIVAVIVIIYGGYIYMTAAGNDEQRKRGRTILTWAVVGLIVVILAVVLVNVVVKLLVEKSVV